LANERHEHAIYSPVSDDKSNVVFGRYSFALSKSVQKCPRDLAMWKPTTPASATTPMVTANRTVSAPPPPPLPAAALPVYL